MTYEVVGFLIVALLAVVFLPPLLGRAGLPVSVGLIRAAICLRVVGSLARYWVLYGIYGGVGDATGYYGRGLRFANRLWAGDLSVFSARQWFDSSGWWGTDFLRNVSGIVVSLVGPSVAAAFLAFSLLAFLGLFAIVLAIWRGSGDERTTRAAMLIWLWPSLFFWPASIGKEAFLTFAIGLAVLGYVGREQKISWGFLVSGIALVFCVRPHYAGAVVVSMGIAHLIPTWNQHGGLRKAVELTGILIAMAGTLVAAQGALGLGDADLEGLREFVEFRGGQTLQGGSSIGALPSGPLAPLQAFVNIWMRPFLWEAHNILSIFAALEIAALWAIVWRFRRDIWALVKDWRHSRFYRFAIPFWAGITLMLGLNFGNLGIIARQRSLAFPFFLAMIAAVPVTAAGTEGRAAEAVERLRGRFTRRRERPARRALGRARGGLPDAASRA